MLANQKEVHMEIREVMTQGVEVVRPDATAKEAAEKMKNSTSDLCPFAMETVSKV
jgi:hypothetical protein